MHRYHVDVAGVLGHLHMFPVGPALFLPFLAVLRLLAGSGLLLGHVWRSSGRWTAAGTSRGAFLSDTLETFQFPAVKAPHSEAAFES